ncbi:TetR/AcrR family transcriptional regulator [Vineibacter terrae]|uniref:TetR/AcrR family transcriptional regulator n=1 Tax=Vineibacter terrae TaxID=2586908 RepID=UPI0015B6C06D|nr:TetR/AcrR family transcriptional regulator [Vineibacter terrae]
MKSHTRSTGKPPPGDTAADADTGDGRRGRIMEATAAVLMERGYVAASTREIAARAKVSKRELYALFGSKQGILAAMFAARSARMRQKLAPPDVADRDALAATLTQFGATVLKEICAPSVVAMHRLAILEAERSPELARTLDDNGRGANHAALVGFLTQARDAGLVGGGEPATIAARFFAILIGDLILRLIMGVSTPPSPREIARRADAATAAVLALYAHPKD